MNTVQLRNLPEETYRDLKDSAEKARRSITQQAIYLLQQALDQLSKEEQYKNAKNQTFERITELNNRKIYNREQTIAWIREDRDQ